MMIEFGWASPPLRTSPFITSERAVKDCDSNVLATKCLLTFFIFMFPLSHCPSNLWTLFLDKDGVRGDIVLWTIEEPVATEAD